MNRCKYNVHVEWETGEKTHERIPVLATDDPVTCASYTKGNGISHIDGWKRFKNLGKRDKHDLSSIASPKGEMKSTFSWTSFYKIHTSSTLCFAEPTLENLNQAKLLYSIKLSSGTSLSVLRSPSETNRVSDRQSILVTTPSSRRILDKPKIEVTKVLIHHVGKNGEHFYGEIPCMNTPQKVHQVKPPDGHPSCLQQIEPTHGHPSCIQQANPTHGDPSCIQQMCKRNIQPWAQPLRS